MKSKMRVVALLASVVALCLALTGCAGGGNGDSGNSGNASNANKAAEVAKNPFVGSWKLVGGVTNGEEITAADIQELESQGMTCVLTAAEDGTYSLLLFGSTSNGTWKSSSATEAVFTIDSGSLNATLKDGELALLSDGDSLVFARVDGEAATVASSASAASTAGATSAASSGSSSTSVAINEVIADDELCTILCVDKKVDRYGYAGYTLKLVNKTADKTIAFTSDFGSFSVDKKMMDFLLAEIVKPGMTAEPFGFFSQEDVPNLAALKNVEGSIKVIDHDTYEVLGTYDFRIA